MTLIFRNEKGEELESMLFPDTMVESYSERKIVVESNFEVEVELTPLNTEFIEYVSYPDRLKPGEIGHCIVKYKPTKEKFKALDGSVGFKIKAI